MTHASLFSGIGGFDLAAEWAGWENAFNCEIDPFCRKVLKYYFPKAEQYGNIKTTDFTVWRGRIDVLSGGFPCQPFSVAGKRRGTEDDRHLWPEMLRAIREIAPRWVVGENVLGIVNWSDGLVFEQVCADLEAEGYEVLPFVLPAAGVGAPHLRYRTWFIAHRADAGPESLQEREDLADRCEAVADAERTRLSSLSIAERIGAEEREVAERCLVQPACTTWGTLPTATWEDFPTQSPVCSRDDELSMRLDGITVPKWRQESIKAYGNAVVPELVRRIFDTINRYHNQLKSNSYGKQGERII